jgi:hypothetical protein
VKKRSISKSGAPELGEPFYSPQQLGHFNERYVERLRVAVATGLEHAVEGVTGEARHESVPVHSIRTGGRCHERHPQTVPR